MRRLLVLTFVLLLFPAADALAHCQKCSFDQNGCASCVSTDFNAWVLCDVIYNGYACGFNGQCEGPGGEQCQVACRQQLVASMHPGEMKARGEWQLVSVEIERPQVAAKQRKLRS